MFNSDLLHFPFLSSVWGSVSDWALIFVTAFTLYFLRKTLKSQLKVQEFQQEINRIEVGRHIREQKLRFEIHIDKPEILTHGDSEVIYILIARIKPLNGGCKDIKIDFKFKYGTIEYIDQVLNFDFIPENIAKYIKVRGKMDRHEFDITDNEITVTITFKDLTGFSFEQSFRYRFGFTNSYTIINSTPIFLPNFTKK